MSSESARGLKNRFGSRWGLAADRTGKSEHTGYGAINQAGLQAANEHGLYGSCQKIWAAKNIKNIWKEKTGSIRNLKKESDQWKSGATIRMAKPEYALHSRFCSPSLDWTYRRKKIRQIRYTDILGRIFQISMVKAGRRAFRTVIPGTDNFV